MANDPTQSSAQGNSGPMANPGGNARAARRISNHPIFYRRIDLLHVGIVHFAEMRVDAVENLERGLVTDDAMRQQSRKPSSTAGRESGRKKISSQGGVYTMDAVRRGVEHAASQARDIVGSRKFHRGKGSRRTGGSGKPARWTRARAGPLAVRSSTHNRITQPGLWASLRKGSAPAPARRSGRCFRLIEHAPGRNGNAGPGGRACAGASPGDADV